MVVKIKTISTQTCTWNYSTQVTIARHKQKQQDKFLGSNHRGSNTTFLSLSWLSSLSREEHIVGRNPKFLVPTRTLLLSHWMTSLECLQDKSHDIKRGDLQICEISFPKVVGHSSRKQYDKKKKDRVFNFIFCFHPRMGNVSREFPFVYSLLL